MASAWGTSWGVAWGSSWGGVSTGAGGSDGGSARQRKRVLKQVEEANAAIIAQQITAPKLEYAKIPDKISKIAYDYSDEDDVLMLMLT